MRFIFCLALLFALDRTDQYLIAVAICVPPFLHLHTSGGISILELRTDFDFFNSIGIIMKSVKSISAKQGTM